MVCVCINSCYLHADRGVCVCLDTPPGVSVLHEGVCTHHVEAHKCLCVFEHICPYKSVYFYAIFYFYMGLFPVSCSAFQYGVLVCT